MSNHASSQFEQTHTLSAIPPFHVVYGGAHLFKRDTIAKMTTLAQQYWQNYGTLDAIDALFPELDAEQQKHLQNTVAAQLRRCAVSDFRIDFEDGYGQRSDTDEDADAIRTAQEAFAYWQTNTGIEPTKIGIRIRALSTDKDPHAHQRTVRAMRTLHLFVDTFCQLSNNRLPTHFCVTLPKVEHPEESKSLDAVLFDLEKKHHLPYNSIEVELMAESAHFFASSANMRAIVEGAGARLRSIHLGAYDLLSSLRVAAPVQSLGHPWCTASRFQLVSLAAEKNLAIADGAALRLAIAPHKGNAADLSEQQRHENQQAVLAAWQSAKIDVERALYEGIYQGWDLHPSMIPVRLAALHAFFQKNYDAIHARLQKFQEAQERATRIGQQFDDAASIRGIVQFMQQALACGAVAG